MNRFLRSLVSIFVALLIITVAFVAFSRTGRPAAPVYDLVITNARVIDGTGAPAFRGDVGIKAGRIARVGHIETRDGRETIDAHGQVLAPGFIDVHTHVESIFNQPEAENFVRMGVTTLVTGNCGFSATDIGQFLGRVKTNPISVNLATLIAHGSVRGKVLGLENRAPSPEELAKMQALVEQGMKDGAVGLSTGLIYVPGTYAKTDEIVALARTAARYGGLYATHMRDEGSNVVAAIRESIKIGEEAKLPVEISHFKITSKSLWGQSNITLGLVRDARAHGLPVSVDEYAYTASSTSLDVLLPDWALEGGREEGTTRLEDNATRERIRRDMLANLKRGGFDDYSYAVVASYEPNAAFDGKSIAEITKQTRGKTDIKAQIEQIFEMYEAGGAGMVYHKMNEADVERIMREPFTMIASDSGVHTFGEGVPHPRGYGNNARVLGHYVRELHLMPLEEAIRKMTSLPAQTFKLRDRGLIREGYAADFVLFDDVRIADQATYDKPHQYPTGISRVIVNGATVFADNQMTKARPGMALRRWLRVNGIELSPELSPYF